QMEHNRMESLNRAIRTFLASIRSDYMDENFGVILPRAVVPEEIFGVLLKISADKNPGELIENIRISAEQMLEDGYFQTAGDLMNVYDAIMEYTRDETQDMQLYHMLVDVLHGTEMEYVMINLENKSTKDDMMGES